MAKKNWTKEKYPVYLEDFYDAHKEELNIFNNPRRPYDSVKYSIVYNDINIPIYSPYLYSLFKPENKAILNDDPLITTRDIFDSFLKGYQKGLVDFEINHKISPNNLYSNSETYMKKVQRLYFGQNNPKSRGCEYYKSFHPLGITLEGMEKVGFAYGHLIEIEKLVNTEKELFASVLTHNQKDNKITAEEHSTTSKEHPKHDPNLWNKKCYNLFKYLFDNYYTSKARELTNIWFFLKENDSDKYVLKATKDQYKTFIIEEYAIKITNFDKALQKYADKEYGTMNDHRIIFEDSLK